MSASSAPWLSHTSTPSAAAGRRERVLDAGVALLADGGYGAFTIGAVCDRAQVAPRALYARADSKDALVLAVYEHCMARVRVRADHHVFGGPDTSKRVQPNEDLLSRV